MSSRIGFGLMGSANQDKRIEQLRPRRRRKDPDEGTHRATYEPQGNTTIRRLDVGNEILSEQLERDGLSAFSNSILTTVGGRINGTWGQMPLQLEEHRTIEKRGVQPDDCFSSVDSLIRGHATFQGRRDAWNS